MEDRTPPVHVAAGVLSDAEGRVLLARRTAGRDMAGAWEFPGGKVEPGEDALAGLARELHEELGIAIDVPACSPLIAVPFAYAGKRIVLDVYRVPAWQGRPQGLEKQALSWVPIERLSRYTMPPADRPVVAALQHPATYLITPEPTDDLDGFVAGLEAALRGGVRRVQLRAKRMAPDALRPLAARVIARCREVGAELLINGDIAQAQELRVGVHLTAAQLGQLRKRPLPASLPVGASCHDAQELARAEVLGVDFVVLGPVARTGSHPGAVPLGWEGFAALRERTPLPIYALGGMQPGDLEQARRHGAQGVAGISAFWPQDAAPG